MSPEGEKVFLQEIGCLKAMVAEMKTQLHERQHRCNSHGKDIENNEKRIGTVEKTISGLKAWIAAAGVVGGVIGWVGHALFGRIGP